MSSSSTRVLPSVWRRLLSDSPVAKFTSIRTVLALSAQLGMKVCQMNVDTAFLNADISENIWANYGRETPVPDWDDEVYKLKK